MRPLNEYFLWSMVDDISSENVSTVAPFDGEIVDVYAGWSTAITSAPNVITVTTPSGALGTTMSLATGTARRATMSIEHDDANRVVAAGDIITLDTSGAGSAGGECHYCVVVRATSADYNPGDVILSWSGSVIHDVQPSRMFGVAPCDLEVVEGWCVADAAPDASTTLNLVRDGGGVGELLMSWEVATGAVLHSFNASSPKATVKQGENLRTLPENDSATSGGIYSVVLRCKQVGKAMAMSEYVVPVRNSDIHLGSLVNVPIPDTGRIVAIRGCPTKPITLADDTMEFGVNGGSAFASTVFPLSGTAQGLVASSLGGNTTITKDDYLTADSLAGTSGSDIHGCFSVVVAR